MLKEGKKKYLDVSEHEVQGWNYVKRVDSEFCITLMEAKKRSLITTLLFDMQSGCLEKVNMSI